MTGSTLPGQPYVIAPSSTVPVDTAPPNTTTTVATSSTVVVPTQRGDLPVTGGDAVELVVLGAGIFLVGAVFVTVARRWRAQ